MTLKPSNLGATTNNYLGKSQFSDPYVNGNIDDLRIYSSALTGSQIANLYQSGFFPSVATAASASPASVPGTTTQLSVLGADDNGEVNLTYTWSLAGVPPAPVSFSANGANAAKNTTAAFTKAGDYNLMVTMVNLVGLSTTSSVSVPVSFGLFSDSGDIGSPALGGSMNYNASNSAYTIKAGGTDIWDASDQFRYTYEGFNGNGRITARVASVSNTNAWAKAGPMFRDSAAANAAFADVVATPGSGVSFQWRSTAGGTPGFAQVTGVAAPVWLRLSRVGNQFSAYYSTNNVTWTQIGATQTVTMATAALAGLAVTSHNAAALTTSVMDNVSLNATPTVATAASASPSPVAGTTANLSVLGADDGGEANLTYTWSMASGPAAVNYSANGGNAAKTTVATFNRAGTYTFLVTIADAGGLSATSSVSVTVSQTYSGLSLSPASPNLTGGAAQQFTATALDQFGQPMSPQPAMTWTLDSGLGTLSTSGLYTPPYASGSATVRVASGSYSATAAVTYSSQAQWNAAISGSWTTGGNWKDVFTSAALAAPGIRGLTGDTILFASATGPIVRLDGANPTLAGITFDNAATSYTIDQGSAGGLTLQGGNGAAVSALAGSHIIAAPVHLAGNTTFNAAATSMLTVTRPIDGSGGLTMTGGGQLVLDAANTFSGGLAVQSGTVVVKLASGLRDGSSLTIGAESTNKRSSGCATMSRWYPCGSSRGSETTASCAAARPTAVVASSHAAV